MKGTIVNSIAIIIGSIIGLLFNKLITKNIKKIIMQALGLGVIIIGIQMALKTQNVLILIFSLIIGGIIGEIIDLEKRLDSLGEFFKKKTKSKQSRFVEGFVSSSLIFCIGAMAIVGSIEDGINNNPSILYTKALLDGSASIAFSSVLGLGVLFSFIPVFIYQTLITLIAFYAKEFLTQTVINEISATGGILIIGIGITILEIKKIKIGNLLPSIIVALILALFFI
jgi:uncharacterized membrane protein YqgA involved in biofilm formation